LKLHPDTHLASLKLSPGPNSTINEHPDAKATNEEFIRVAEAWSVLSKADLKQQYDLMWKHGGSSEVSDPGIFTSEVSSTYSTQKSAYHRSVKQKASSNWAELKDKYKSEKWQNLPLAQKKVV